jgi:hypothetical protein
METQCPEEINIMGYISGQFTKAQKTQFQIHMASCDYCRKEFVMTNKILKELEPEQRNYLAEIFDKLNTRIQDIREAIVSYISPSRLQPAYARPVRDDDESKSTCNCLKKSIKDLHIEVYILNPMSSSTHVRVQINDGKSKLMVFLINDKGQEKAEYMETGFVTFEDVSYGPYQLKIETLDSESVQFACNIQNTGIF